MTSISPERLVSVDAKLSLSTPLGRRRGGLGTSRPTILTAAVAGRPPYRFGPRQARLLPLRTTVAVSRIRPFHCVVGHSFLISVLTSSKSQVIRRQSGGIADDRGLNVHLFLRLFHFFYHIPSTSTARCANYYTIFFERCFCRIDSFYTSARRFRPERDEKITSVGRS